MAVKMTWVSVPTNYIPRFTIPDSTVNASAVRNFNQNVYDIYNFLKDLVYITDQAYGCFVLAKGEDIIYEKLNELYDVLQPVYEHYLELSEWFMSNANSMEISRIEEICYAKRAEVNSKISKIPGVKKIVGDCFLIENQTSQDEEKLNKLNKLRRDLEIISDAEDGGYNGN